MLEPYSPLQFDRLFVLVFCCLYLLINSSLLHLLDLFGIDPTAHLFPYLLFSLWNLIIAYRLVITFAMLFPARELPHLCILDTSPRVAILYLCKDDLSSASLECLLNIDYPLHDVFILDDSVNINIDPEISHLPFRVVRRSDRRGYKAGNLNNWFKSFGPDYKYFIVLDSDSQISETFITEMLCYAEHFANNNIAIFQAQLCVLATPNPLSRYQNSMLQIQHEFFSRIGNRISTVQNWGHNLLVRTSAIMQVNGFNENFIGEDVATSFDLYESGWLCRYVKVPSWEEVPYSLTAFASKYVRTTMSNLQLLLRGTWDISLFQKLYLYMSVFPALLLMVSLPFMVYSVCHQTISINVPYYLYTDLASRYAGAISLLWLLCFTLVFFDTYLYVRAGIKGMDIILAKLSGSALTFYILWPFLFKIFSTLKGNKFSFSVTPKNHMVTFHSRFNYYLAMLPIVIMLICSIYNPIILLSTGPWILLFLTSLIMLLNIQKMDDQQP